MAGTRVYRVVRGLSVVLVLWVGSSAVEAADRFWVAGGLGLGFGQAEYVSVSAVAGYFVTPKFTPGGRIFFRSRHDTRYERDVKTSDYGAGIFARYFVKKPFYLHAEYEHLNYEFVQFDGGTDHDTFNSLLFGGGAGTKFSKHGYFYGSLLYNFSYDDSDLRSPYTSPWVFRLGIGFII